MADTQEWVMNALEELGERKAEHLVAYDVKPMGIFTDWVVLATATSDVHIRALSRYLVDRLAEAGQTPRFARRRDEPSHWVVLDYGDFVVHLFLAESRAHYHLEALYKSCASITR
ncbi:MAG: ribosome silencing factor [Spirochaetes bacterium]|nr:ribosome silencing factor [Spirochaetota bacterium]